MYALDVELLHGYTLGDLDDIARTATNTDWSHHAGDYLDRYHIARSAAAIALYAADKPPRRNRLVNAARNALSRDMQAELKQRAVSHHTYDPAVRAYQYWALARVTPSHETTIVDQQALRQIWPRLRDEDRAALVTLATLGDYSRAAEALGLQYYTFCKRVWHARERFLRFWHEGEKPSGLWGRDKRAGAGLVPAENPTTATRTIGRRRAAARRAARDA